MPIPVAAAAAIAKAAPLVASAVAKAAPMVTSSAVASGVAKAAPQLASVATRAGLPALASWIDKLNKSGALSRLNFNATRNRASTALAKVRRTLAGNAAKNVAMRLSKDNVGSALDSIISANGLPYLGMGNGKRFIDEAMGVFLSSYLPQALSQGELDETGLGQLLLPFGGMLQPKANPTFSALADRRDGGGVDWEALLDYYLNEGGDGDGDGGGGSGYIPNFVLGDSGPTVSGPFGDGPSGSGTGGELARVFGYGGQPGGGWSWQAEPAELYNADPFAEQNAEMKWRRKQQKKQAKFDRKLQEKNQEWIERRMDQYYRKKPSQWAKEKGLEAAGTLAAIAGQGMNAYNSILANSLMQSAASTLSRRQEEMYGNPLLPGTSMIAGGHMARGQIADVVGQNLGEFLKNWGQDIAGEFERMRGLRIQMDINPSGRAMDALYKLGRYYGRNTHTEGKGYV